MSNPMQQAGPSGSNVPQQGDIDKQRVTLILDINSHLLEQIQILQANGKGGDVQSPAQGVEGQAKKPPREYVEPLRRMQANLAYLASLSERHQKPNSQQPPWPQVMTGYPGDEKLAGMYTQLQGLFPQWKVQQQRIQAAQLAQAQQAAGGAQGLQNMSGPMMGGQQQQMMGGMGQMGGNGNMG